MTPLESIGETERAAVRVECLAVLPMSQLLRTDGFIAKLQARGYDVEAP